MKSRRLLRVKVMEVLYAHQIGGDPIDKIKKDLLSNIDSAEAYNFVVKLINEIILNKSRIEKLIVSKLNNWEYDKISVIDKILLEIGTAELLFFPEIPPKVTINEAIEIAKTYSTAQSSKFVNGILDAILNELKSSGQLVKTGRGLIDKKPNPPDEK
ncbi:MAG: transcription antitermination factor NusB [Ignavibacteria bacterium]